MNFLGVLSRKESNFLRLTTKRILRLYTDNSNHHSCAEPKSPEKIISPPPPSADATCPQPPPCPEPRPCPPRLCPEDPAPGDPCNYCPPVYRDENYPDLTKMKKNQCLFQEENGLPVYLKGGTKDVILYQATLIGVITSTIINIYNLLTLS